MIKNNLIFLLFYLVMGTVHYLLIPYIEDGLVNTDFFLIYLFLLLVNVLGNLLFYFNQKLDLMSFSAAFIIFTVVQLLACMSFALTIKMLRTDEAKLVLLHFVVVFFISLIFQSVYFVRNQAEKIKE